MAGTRVVPGVRAFLGCFAENLVELDVQVGVKLLQEHCQGGAHDASADQEHIGLVSASCRCHSLPPSDSSGRLTRMGVSLTNVRLDPCAVRSGAAESSAPAPRH